MSSGGLRAFSYQVTLKLVRGKTLEYATNSAITYTRCCTKSHPKKGGGIAFSELFRKMILNGRQSSLYNYVQ